MRPDWPILASLAQKTCHFICFRFCECINCFQGFLPLESSYFHYSWCYQASILYKSIASRYLPVSYPDGPITARYRFIKNAYWVVACGGRITSPRTSVYVFKSFMIIESVPGIWKSHTNATDEAHYENTPIQIYWKFHHQKMKVFR